MWRGVACHNPWYPWYLPSQVPQSQILRWKVGNGTTGGVATQKFEIKIYRWNAFQKYQVICMNYFVWNFGLDHIWIGSNIGSKAIHKSRLPMVGFENKLASLKSQLPQLILERVHPRILEQQAFRHDSRCLIMIHTL